MAMTPTSAIVSTSGDTWTTLLTGPAIVTQVICAINAFGLCKVSLRLSKGSSSALIVPGDALPEGGSHRLRVGAISLAAGDKLEAKSIGAVDWTISGTTL